MSGTPAIALLITAPAAQAAETERAESSSTTTPEFATRPGALQYRGSLVLRLLSGTLCPKIRCIQVIATASTACAERQWLSVQCPRTIPSEAVTPDTARIQEAHHR